MFCLKNSIISKDHTLIEDDFFEKLSIFLIFCSFNNHFSFYKHLYDNHLNLNHFFNIKPLPKLNLKYLDKNDPTKINELFYLEFSRIIIKLLKQVTNFRLNFGLDNKIKFPYFKYLGKKIENFEEKKKKFFKEAMEIKQYNEEQFKSMIRFHPDAFKLREIIDGIKIHFGPKNLMKKHFKKEIFAKKIIPKEYLILRSEINKMEKKQKLNQYYNDLSKDTLNLGLKLKIDFEGFMDVFEDIPSPNESK